MINVFWKLYGDALAGAGDGGDVIDPHLFYNLIVDECVTVLNKRFMGDLNREDMEVRRCIDDIKKHFGVEE